MEKKWYEACRTLRTRVDAQPTTNPIAVRDGQEYEQLYEAAQAERVEISNRQLSIQPSALNPDQFYGYDGGGQYGYVDNGMLSAHLTKLMSLMAE